MPCQNRLNSKPTTKSNLRLNLKFVPKSVGEIGSLRQHIFQPMWHETMHHGLDFLDFKIKTQTKHNQNDSMDFEKREPK